AYFRLLGMPKPSEPLVAPGGVPPWRELSSAERRGGGGLYHTRESLMSEIRPPDSHLDLLERPLFAHLATVANDCSPRVNPMWFHWDNQTGLLKLTHTNRRHNYRNL